MAPLCPDSGRKVAATTPATRTSNLRWVTRVLWTNVSELDGWQEAEGGIRLRGRTSRQIVEKGQSGRSGRVVVVVVVAEGGEGGGCRGAMSHR